MRTDRALDPDDPRRHRVLRGRDVDLARLTATLASGERLVTLRGTPGVGKTSVARAVVDALVGSGRRAFYVSLATSDGRAAILLTLARALGLSATTSDDTVVLEGIVRELETCPTTLVIDGIDADRAGVRTIVLDLLEECGELVTLVCSRSSLGASLEVIVALEPLPLDDAIELLVERVRQAGASATLHPRHAADLARRSGGLPLAIEIIAGWVAALGADETLSSLEDGGLALDALDRALDVSWGNLTSEERSAFACWSVFRHGFDLAGARAVASSGRAAAHLAMLVSTSLVNTNETRDGMRYEMLEGVRAYATRRAREGGYESGARERLARHLATSERPRADLPSSWRRLTEERDDLVASWRYAVDHDPRLALRLAVVLEPSLAAQGPPTLHRTLLERTVAAVATKEGTEIPDEHARAVIDLFFALGRLSSIRGDHVAACPPFERGVALAMRHSDDVRRGWLLAHLAISRCALGSVAEARSMIDQASAIARAVLDARLLATVERAVGALAFVEGDLDGASSAYRRSATAARSADAPRLEGLALLELGRVRLEERQIDDAAALFDDARRLFRSANDVIHVARLSVHDGAIALERGLLDDAEQTFATALDQVVLQADIEGELEARMGLTRIARARGVSSLAERRRDDFDLALRRAGSRPWWQARRATLEGVTSPNIARAPVVLRLDRDGRVVELASKPLDFARRGPLRRILVALAMSHSAGGRRALSVADLLEAGWPSERMLHESGTARVYMAIRRLRILGLDAVLRTSDEGYSLDDHVVIVWREPG